MSGHFLVLDNDIVFAGKVLSLFDEVEADCVVGPMLQSESDLQLFFFDLEKLREYDPDYVYPGWVFNSGQIVTHSGILYRQEMEPLVDWEDRARARRQDIFRCADQGMLNYLLQKKHSQGTLQLAQVDFRYWGHNPHRYRLNMREVARGQGPKLLFHWAGEKSIHLRGLNHGQLIRFFEGRYYAQVPGGFFKRRWRQCLRDYQYFKTNPWKFSRPRIPQEWKDLVPDRLRRKIPRSLARLFG